MKEQSALKLGLIAIGLVLLMGSVNVYSMQPLTDERYNANKKEVSTQRREQRQHKNVPELNASGAPIALALVGGLAAISLERKRRRKDRLSKHQEN